MGSLGLPTVLALKVSSLALGRNWAAELWSSGGQMRSSQTDMAVGRGLVAVPGPAHCVSPCRHYRVCGAMVAAGWLMIRWMAGAALLTTTRHCPPPGNHEAMHKHTTQCQLNPIKFFLERLGKSGTQSCQT